MTTIEVASRCKVSKKTVQKWAENNNVKRGTDIICGIIPYDFSEDDIERFKKRPKAGRPPKADPNS